MRTIAENHIKALTKPPRSIKQDITSLKNALIKMKKALFFGTISVVFYTLLYFYSSDLVLIAQDTHHGHKTLFYFPILIALIFSFAHGKFTALFWDLLGVHAKSS